MARLENKPATVPTGARETLNRLLSISHLAIEYPWATLALWAILSVAGIFAFSSLKLALFPDITFPVVVVTAHSGQIDVDKNEATLTNPLERRLETLPGLTRIHSLTYPEYAVIDMSFDVSAGLTVRRNQVADALAGVKLPAGAQYSISTLNLNETPVVTYALVRKTLSLEALAAIAKRDLVPKLMAIPGVLKTQIIGGQTTGNSASAYRYDGREAVAVSVIKQAQSNTLDVADAVATVVQAFDDAHPELSVAETSDQADYIREATRATQEALALAVFLAVLVILPFLRDWRATMISAIAIPVSLLGTACVMWLCRFNLETITLLALALVTGVIVDDAIVAVENIVRHLEAGETPKEAALKGNKEIGLTLVAASLTIVAVFLPIGLMRGTLGQFFRAFGITASAAVLFSLLAARTLSPALAAWWLKPRVPAGAAPIDVNHTGLHPRYRQLIGWALVHRRYVIGLAIFAFAVGLGLIPFIPKGFIPHLDRGEFLVNFQTPLGTSLGDTLAVGATLEASVARDPAVTDVFLSVGSQPGQQNVGVLDVRLRHSRKVTTLDVEDAVRGRLPSIDGVVTTVEDVPFVGTETSKPVQFALISNNLDTLRTVGRQFEHRVEKLKGFLDVTASGFSDGTPFSAIEHVEGRRAVQITADLAGNLQIGDADDKILALRRKYLPKTIALAFGGSSEDVVTTFRDFGIALALGVVAIFVVLLALFRSWVDAIVIIGSLPLSIVGALLALFVTRADFGLISLMAVIFLFGLVNKNAILLVDRINKLRSLGFDRYDAIREAGAQRLRPIVMTTSATILGMLPIALGFGAGAELRQPMAVAIIGGLISSTLLSLVVIPVAYTIFDDLTHGGAWHGRPS